MLCHMHSVQHKVSCCAGCLKGQGGFTEQLGRGKEHGVLGGGQGERVEHGVLGGVGGGRREGLALRAGSMGIR